MAKTFFQPPSYYEGLKARRIKQSGRLWLVRVISEEERPVQYPYWFVIIRNFNLEKDWPVAQLQSAFGVSAMRIRLMPSLLNWNRSIPPIRLGHLLPLSLPSEIGLNFLESSPVLRL